MNKTKPMTTPLEHHPKFLITQAPSLEEGRVHHEWYDL